LIIFKPLEKKLMKLRVVLLSVLSLSFAGQAYSQGGVSNPGNLVGSQRAITTAVPFLAITPDARHAGLGDAGVATSPDANSAYWNAGKLAFIDKKYGGSLSYTPWLGKIINDMWISSLSGFYKISHEQTIGASLKYFDLGQITFNTGPDLKDIIGVYNPKEAAFDVTYSRLLSENLSVGISGRYIYSNITGAFSGSDAQAGNSVAADVGVFYTKELKNASNSTLSLGAQISNIGAKLSYTNNNNKDFLPTNLRIGSAYTTHLDAFNTITFILDFNKLMVPSVDSSGQQKSLLSGMFGSFTDAPGGAKEELHEIMTSAGVEYWYNQTFSGRLGYFLEAKDKGNRKYLTLGVGFRKNNFGLDMAYIVPTNQREHPLAETLRFSILLQIPTVEEREDSVTD
jgi:hypothetical protein